MLAVEGCRILSVFEAVLVQLPTLAKLCPLHT